MSIRLFENEMNFENSYAYRNKYTEIFRDSYYGVCSPYWVSKEVIKLCNNNKYVFITKFKGCDSYAYWVDIFDGGDCPSRVVYSFNELIRRVDNYLDVDRDEINKNILKFRGRE